MPRSNYTLVVSKWLSNVEINEGDEVDGLADALKEAGYCVQVIDNRIPIDDPTFDKIQGIPK